MGMLEIDKLDNKFSNEKEFYDTLMFEIQSRMVMIDDMKSDKNPDVINACADIAILSKMLALHEGASEDTFKEQLTKVKEIFRQ